MRLTTACAGLAFIAVMHLGCAAGDDAPQDATGRDSAGVRIIESVTPVWTEEERWHVAAEPTLSIGVADGRPEYQFHDIEGVVQGPEGRIVVANGGTAELRFYGPDGKHLRTVGRRGEGPGEFRDAAGVALSGDSLLVYDRALNRLSILDRSGTFLDAVRLEPGSEAVYSLAFYHLAGPVPGRGVLLLPRSAPGGIRPTTAVYWHAAPNLLYSFDGTLVDTLGGFSGRDWRTTPESAGPLRFGSQTSADLYRGQLFIGDGKRYEIEVYSPDGALRRLVRKRAAPVPVTDEVFAKLIAWARREVEATGAPPEALAEFRQRVHSEPHAESLPFYSDLLVDALGNLWVERFRPRWAEGAHAWDVFDHTGRWLGTVRLPEGLRVHQIGRNAVLGVWEGKLGVEYVRSYQLERTGR